MATKRGDKVRIELSSATRKPQEEFLERVLQPTDTLQGIALLFNTTVGDLKRVNHIHSDTELHGRKVIKVPARRVLVDLSESDRIPLIKSNAYEEEEDEEAPNGEVFLAALDSQVEDIRLKAQAVAASSPILNGQPIDDLYSVKQESEVSWWKILIPCLAFLIIFPLIFFLFREHIYLFALHHSNSSIPIHNNEHSKTHE